MRQAVLFGKPCEWCGGPNLKRGKYCRAAHRVAACKARNKPAALAAAAELERQVLEAEAREAEEKRRRIVLGDPHVQVLVRMLWHEAERRGPMLLDHVPAAAVRAAIAELRAEGATPP
jgi:hypothetical protein